MTHLGTLVGSGSILVDGVDLGAVDYRIDVFRPNWHVTGLGTIKGDQGLLFKLAGMAEVWLKFQSGDEVQILITKPPIFGDEAEVKTTGTIPGFT